jgi:hypothetical protein
MSPVVVGVLWVQGLSLCRKWQVQPELVMVIELEWLAHEQTNPLSSTVP